MLVYQIYSNKDFVALASTSPKVSKKFMHFILFDQKGSRVYDTSVKVFYDLIRPSTGSTLGLNGKDLYFIFRGNAKTNVPHGYKLYQIKDGSLVSLLKAQDYLKVKPNDSEWEDVQYYYWKDNKFVVLGIETIDGLPSYVIRKIEV
jgi:hypothetical protein